MSFWIIICDSLSNHAGSTTLLIIIITIVIAMVYNTCSYILKIPYFNEGF